MELIIDRTMAPDVREVQVPNKMPDQPWAVILWNDDVNTAVHVIDTLGKLLGMTTRRAERLTYQAHHTGKAVVAYRPKEEAELLQRQFHAKHLRCTIEQG